MSEFRRRTLPVKIKKLVVSLAAIAAAGCAAPATTTPAESSARVQPPYATDGDVASGVQDRHPDATCVPGIPTGPRSSSPTTS
jgi:hypothetical protein